MRKPVVLTGNVELRLSLSELNSHRKGILACRLPAPVPTVDGAGRQEERSRMRFFPLRSLRLCGEPEFESAHDREEIEQ